MNIGVYVGSFDPVHIGHIKIVNYLLDNKMVDQIIIIPTGNYWDKNNLTNINDRTNMLKLFENDQIKVDSYLGKYQYTYEILDELKKQYNNTKLYLIIGADNLEKFHLWKSIDLILQNKVIVISRNGIKVEKYINKFNKKDNFLVVNYLEQLNISSTVIREKIKNGEDVSVLLDEKVKKYIYERKLYGGNYV